jgi:hypothetical protein
LAGKKGGDIIVPLPHWEVQRFVWVSGNAASSVFAGEAVCATASYKWERENVAARLQRDVERGVVGCPELDDPDSGATTTPELITPEIHKKS